MASLYSTNNKSSGTQLGDSIDTTISKMPTFGNRFLMGMKLGYSGTTSLFSPFLSYRKSKQQQKILEVQGELLQMQSQAYQNAAESVYKQRGQSIASLTFQAGQAKESTKVSQAAAGIEVGTGSSARVLASIDIAKEVQKNQIISNAITQAYGYKQQAVDLQNQALAVETSRKSISPFKNALASALNDAVSTSDMLGDMFGGSGANGGKGTNWSTIGSNMMQFFKGK